MESNNTTYGQLKPRRILRRTIGGFVYGLFLLSVCVGIVGLLALLYEVLTTGLPWLNWQFITDYPSRHPEEAGLFSALMGTVWLMAMTAIFTVPVGVGAAIYLEEYAPRNLFTRIIEINVANLAGVPSIVYGLLGLALFVNVQYLRPGLCACNKTKVPASAPAHQHKHRRRGCRRYDRRRNNHHCELGHSLPTPLLGRLLHHLALFQPLPLRAVVADAAAFDGLCNRRVRVDHAPQGSQSDARLPCYVVKFRNADSRWRRRASKLNHAQRT